jgi:nucleoside-diphosphate-sugar epimerase
LGSHIAERLVARGDRVRALTRPGSDTSYLRGLGVEFVEGDLTDPADCSRAVEGVDTLYHAAAKVGDWGSWAEFERSCVVATARLARAARMAGARRFIHISSTSAYGHPPDLGRPIDETHPLGEGLWWPWDYYTLSKVESERVLWDLVRSDGLPLTVIRPSWLYGERDRTTVGRMIERMRGGGIPILGDGGNPLSAIYAGDVAAAAILAASDEDSVGEAYNITDQGPITQREFFDLFARAAGAPPKRWYRRFWHPYPVVFGAGLVFEAIGRLKRSQSPPVITRYAAWLMGRSISYSTAKARQKLGWSPAETYEQSIDRTVRWFLDREDARRPGMEVHAGRL